MNLIQWQQTRALLLQPGAITLIALMAATRFHHFGSTLTLPDASLAVFFLAGLWFNSITLCVVLLLEAGLIDYLAISQFGVSDFCISPAYVFLIPTYAIVWFGGQYSKQFNDQKFSHLTIQFAMLVVTVSLAFVISNGSFYLLSDKYSVINWSEYSARFLQYYPPYLQYAVIYVVAIYILNLLLRQLRSFNSETELPKA